MTTKFARDLKAGDTVNIPCVGWRTLTHVRRSRRYAGCMQLQWDYKSGECGQAEPKCSDSLEVSNG